MKKKRQRNLSRRILAMLLSIVVILGTLPMTVTANELMPNNEVSSENQVRVIVENSTYTKSEGAPWDGVLVDKWVSINDDSTMMTSVVAALDAAGYTQKGAENNYIEEVNGLAAFDGGGMSGWMGTLNDWFCDEGFGGFTVANGKLQSGDEIHIQYTKNYGTDLGGSWGDNTKTLKALSVNTGVLSPDFSSDVKAYTLTVPQGTTGLIVTPTATNKNFQVRASVDGTEYKRSAQIPVADGTVINVKCGDPAWPTMNGAANIPAEVYTVTVSEQGNHNPQLTQDNVEVKTIHGDGSQGDTLSLDFEQDSRAFRGNLANYTDLNQYNDTDVAVTLTGLANGTTAQLKTESGEKIADFANGTAKTTAGAVSKKGTHTFVISLQNGDASQDYTLTLEKTIKAKWTKLVFAGTPAFDAAAVYHGAPEGTLFQLDENGERTGQTGISEDCLNYEVYVSAATKSVKPEGSKALDIFKNSFSYAQFKASVYIDENPLFENVPTIMAMAMKWSSLSKGIALINERTQMRVEFKINEKEVVNSTVTFVVEGKMDSKYLIEALEALTLEKLVWPDDSGKITKLYRGFMNLSDEEKAKISPPLQEKLNKAYELMRDDRVPSSLKIKKPAAKLLYVSGQKFNPVGAELLATYADGTTRTITKDFEIQPAGALTNETEVAFIYNTVRVMQPIKIVEQNFDGDGTQANPYKLTSAKDMQTLNNIVASEQSTEGMHFEMMENITLPNDWKPIGVTKDGTNDIKKGENLSPFSGIIDGKNHTLTVPEGGLPLLGYVKGAEVRNLNIYGKKIAGYGLVNNLEGVGLSGTSIIIDNVTLKSGSSTLKSGLLGANITTNPFAGCSAGFVATVRNCTIEKNVVIGYNKKQSMIGSIAGRMQGTVENCKSYATVYGLNSVGGIIGTRDNAMGISVISNCEFGGVIKSTGEYAGGILGCGYTNSTAPNGGRVQVTGCSSSGTITGTDCVGGIMGADSFVMQSWGQNTFEHNKFTGTVQATDGKYVGGVIGYLGSLNKYDGFSANYYSISCGTDKGIGFVKYVDTSCKTHETESGATYFDTSAALPDVGGVIRADHNRTDDPLGADAHELTSQVMFPNITTQPTGGEYIIPNTAAAIRVISSKPTDGGTLSYQWYSNSVNSTEGAVAIQNATKALYTPTKYSDSNTTYYYCVVTNTVTAQDGKIFTATATSDFAKIQFKTPGEMLGEDRWQGDGTEVSPYLLKTEKDLNVLSTFVKTHKFSFANVYFKVANDITLSEAWNVIGDGCNFSGIFDGGNYTISFAHGSKPLFGQIANGRIKNLKIAAPYINGYGLVNTYKVGSGTMAIDNVTIKSGSCIKYAGFLGGYASGSNVVTITNCTVEKNVKIGYNADANAPTSVWGKGETESIGSFAGDFNGNISNCVSYADVYGTEFVGGFIGCKGQTIGPCSVTNSQFYGTITATGKFAGGIIGSGYSGRIWGIGSAPNTPCVSIEGCTVEAAITGKTNVGGIFGGEEGSIQCWNNGIGKIKNNTFKGTVKAAGHGGTVGGIIGYMNSLNRYNEVGNNKYSADCGAKKGIGRVKYIDTNCSTADTSDASVIYYCTQTGAESNNIPSGAIYKDHNRTDDPLGADADKLTSVTDNQIPVRKGGVQAEVSVSLLANKIYKVNLSSIFEDLDGDALSYKVSVNGKSTAADEKFSYSAKKAGQYTLAFTANDGKNDSKDTYTVVLNVVEPLGIYKETGTYLYNTVTNPIVNSIGGEWAVIGLSRSEFKVDSDYYNKYLANAMNTLKENNGVLHDKKYTEYSRVVLALTSIGYDVTNVAGYNLLKPLADYDKVVWQGINGPIWALIALDSHNYEIPAVAGGKKQTTREALIKAILEAEVSGGGWTLFGSADPDMTGMAFQALAPYYNHRADVKAAVDRALILLSGMQNNKGGFGSWGTVNCESCAQVIIGLTSLGINPNTDARFIKNGHSAIDAMLDFAVDGGGFKHIINGSVNGMATEQAYQALTAYYRLLNGQNSIYNMNDVKIDDAYRAVIELIDAIGTVGLDSGDMIRAARNAYDALSESQKKLVTNYKLLPKAEAEYTKLAANIDQVKNLIDAIGTVTKDSGEIVEKARKAYDNLTKAEKPYVTNYDVLTRAETKLSQLKNADKVISLIEAIGTVTKDSGASIDAARKEYDALSSWEKALVTNYAVLTAAERAYANLTKPIEPPKPDNNPSGDTSENPKPDKKPSGNTSSLGNASNKDKTDVTVDGVKYNVSKKAGTVIEQITKMPKNDKYDLNAVLAAYKTYEKLTEKQKAEVVNYADLEAKMNLAGVDNHQDTANGIKADGLEWYIKLKVKKINTREDSYGKLEDSIGSNKLLNLWDIKLENLLDNSKYQPAGKVKLRAPSTGTEEYDTIMVVHYTDDGQVEYIECKAENGEIVWEVDSFSKYGIIGGEKESDLALNGEPTDGKTTKGAEKQAVESNSLIWLWVVLAGIGMAVIVTVILVRARNSRRDKE